MVAQSSDGLLHILDDSDLPAPPLLPLLLVGREAPSAGPLGSVLHFEQEIRAAPADQQIGNATAHVCERLDTRASGAQRLDDLGLIGVDARVWSHAAAGSGARRNFRMARHSRVRR